MKSKFLPSNTSHGRENQAVRSSRSVDWLPVDADGDVSSAGTGEQAPPPGKGLLSGWQAGQAQSNGASASVPMAEQTTLTLPTVRRPIAGTAASDAVTQYFHTGRVAPRPTPPAVFPATQAYPTFGPQAPPPNPPFAVRPWESLAGPPTPSPMYVAPQAMPGVAQGNWQAGAFQGGQGGQPPFVQPQVYKQERRFPIWARVALGLLALLLMLVGSGLYYYQANFAAPVNNIVNQQVPLLKGESNPNAGRDISNPLNGGRVNILLLGSDTDAKFKAGYLAQTDIVVTIDPATKTVGMLSIPRDLYVNVPGYGMMKLDEAFYTGTARENNGVGLSRRTITSVFGIPINYYAWVGLSGFMKVVDTAGGVDVDINHPIVDDVYPDDTGSSQNAYAYKRLYIVPGPQHLDGLHALEYVRSRHADLVGDFGRSARQQQILGQLKTRLTGSPEIVTKLPQLAQDMNGYLKTDMNLLGITQLMYFARTLDPNKIQHAVLSPPTYSSETTATSGADTGEDIFVANCAPIQQVIAKMFALGNRATCNVQANSNNTGTSVATTTSRQQSIRPVLETAPGNPWQEAVQMQMTGMGPGDSNSGGLLGIRSLLDLLCLAVFESPLGLQV